MKLDEIEEKISKLEKADNEIKEVLSDLSNNFKSLAIALVGDQFNPSGGLTARMKDTETKVLIIENRQNKADKSTNRVLIIGGVIVFALQIVFQILLAFIK